MRRSIADTEFLKDEEENIIGVNLGFDWCAEHECGIKSLQQNFGLKMEKKLGFNARRNIKMPEGLEYCEKDTAALIYQSFYFTSTDKEWQLENVINDVLKLYGDQEVAAAWDESSFGVNVTLEHKDVLNGLYHAFRKKNGIIMLSGRSSPFANNGLLLVDYTKIPAKEKKRFWQADKDFRDEQKLFRKLEKESGVYELLKAKGKEFFALSIKRLDENGEPRWWLNPREQDIYKLGWYTTEELKLWAYNRGPVIKKET